MTPNKKLLESFRDKARAFSGTYDRLKDLDAEIRARPKLKKQYFELLKKGLNIRNSIRSVTGGIDNVVAWFNSVFGRENKPELQGLGILPLIPIAVVVGSVAAMGKWASDVYLFERQLTEIKRLEGGGLTPEQATDVVTSREGRGVFAGITKEIMLPLSIGGFALLLGYYFLNAKK